MAFGPACRDPKPASQHPGFDHARRGRSTVSGLHRGHRVDPGGADPNHPVDGANPVSRGRIDGRAIGLGSDRSRCLQADAGCDGRRKGALRRRRSFGGDPGRPRHLVTRATTCAALDPGTADGPAAERWGRMARGHHPSCGFGRHRAERRIGLLGLSVAGSGHEPRRNRLCA